MTTIACRPSSVDGHRVYDWALVNSSEPDRQYLIRRATDGSELAFYRCHNPNHAGFSEFVHVAGARWPIEECFGAAKNEVGLDNYQVRTWNAWHRHINFALLAHTFLAATAHHANKSGDASTAPRRRRPRNPGTSPTDPADTRGNSSAPTS